MKARELMIGDWVRVSHINKIGKVYRIDQANGDGNGWAAIIDGDYHEHNLEPIVLTKEILEKNGFDVSDREVMQYHFEDPSYLVDGKPEKLHFSLRQMYDKDNNPRGYSFYSFGVLTIIDYVHQLQHAFRLCGIDKDIVL